MYDNASLLSLDSKHPCYLCPAAFVLVSSLELHLASVHGEKLHVVLPGSSTPDRCDAGNCSNTDIDKEIDSHSNKKMTINDDNVARDKDGEITSAQHVCDVCRKSFSEMRNLKRHKVIHSDSVKPSVCDVCSKSFTRAADLKKHKRIHTGERPYKCPYCDGDFNQSSSLHSHIKLVHENDRPHVCDVCRAGFSKKSDLTVHKRTHTDEKPYVCSECGKGFAQKGNLAQHRLTHTGEKPHSCPHCPDTFRFSSQLKRHVQSKHQ